MDPDLSRGVRAGVLAYLVWGLLTIYWKQLSAFGAIELIGWRMAMAAVVMAAIVTARGRWHVIRRVLGDGRLLLRVTAAGLLLTVNWTTYVWAVVSDHVIETALGYFLAPLGTMAIGVFLLGERLTSLKRVAIGFAIVAVVILTVSYGRPPLIALLLAGSWTLYGLAKRRVPLTPIESLASETFVLLIPALAIIGWGATRASGVPSIASGTDWIFLAGTGLVTAVPLLLFATAAQRVPFTVLGPLNYLVPIINFVLGWWLYGESLPAVRVVGFAMVWFALVAVTIDMIRSNRSTRLREPIAAT